MGRSSIPTPIARGRAVDRLLRSALLRLHGVVRRCGVLSTPPGRRLFEFSYDLYKARFEAGEIAGLRRYVTPDSCVIDVGANIGFFTVRFARWVSGEGRVLALEPEAENHRRLRSRLARSGLGGRVEALRAAAAEREGEAFLEVNPDHPGDHRLGVPGPAPDHGGRDGLVVPVPAVTIDGLLAERGWPAVSLVKIDVQGAEPRVIAGAAATLDRFAPAIWMEIDPSAMERAGTDPHHLLAMMAAADYRPHRLTRIGPGPALDPAAAAALAYGRGYADFLFLRRTLSARGDPAAE